MALLLPTAALAVCGERGGPGYRGPDGRCVSWAALGRVCGTPPTKNCNAEIVTKDIGTATSASTSTTAIGLLSAKPAGVTVSAGAYIGQASVIDADTLEIHGQRIRLSGIDAPESDQLCRGADSNHYRCGQKSANDLAVFIDHRPVECIEVDRDRYNRAVAVCAVGGIDLADWLVSNGLALDWPRYSDGAYANQQREAERASKGMWAGSFVAPWDYRSCTKGLGNIETCSDEAKPK